MVLDKIIRFLFKKYFEKKLFMLGVAHCLRMRPLYKEIKNINDVEFKIFSQNGEDGIIDYISYSLKLDRPKFIEIGIGDYSESNTRFIFESTSPKGAVIDCINNLENKIKKTIKIWKGDLKIINKKLDTENCIKLLNQDNMLEDLDLFSIDIDGIDYWILEKLPKHFSKIVILEYNPIFGYDLVVSVPNLKDFDRNKYHYSNLCFGMSFKAAIKIMKEKGFYFIGSNYLKNNAFFVSDKFQKNIYFEKLKIDLSSLNIDSNFRESRDTNGNLNYLSKDKALVNIYDCEVVDLSDNNFKIKKIKHFFI
jgi:hypothetical protein